MRSELFGPFEPTPEWSIWPAGYFVSVLYVARAPRLEPSQSEAEPSRGASSSPGPAPSAKPPPGSEWPAMIDVGAEDHLLWLGINTPIGWSLDRAALYRIDGDGHARVIPTRRLASPWPDHFTALALLSNGVDHSLAVWPAGVYRLELSASPGNVRRTIGIHIETAPDRTRDDDRGAGHAQR